MNWSGLISSVKVEANFLPPLEIEKPLAGKGENIFAKLLQPKLTVFVGGNPLVIAPYGEPNPAKSWVWIPLIVGILFLVLIVIGRLTK